MKSSIRVQSGTVDIDIVIRILDASEKTASEIIAYIRKIQKEADQKEKEKS